ncbi:MAG: spore germination protein [Firmicutes bacterium]|nr:spore germination protein [Bacillota bacterium]
MIENAEKILNKFPNDDLVKRRDFVFNGKKGAMLFMPDLTKEEVLEKTIFALNTLSKDENKKIKSAKDIIENLLFTRHNIIESDIEEATNFILSGDAVVIIDGFREMIVVDSKAWDKRSIMEPPVENVLRGPREGFIEDVKTNLTLIQRRMRSTNLKVERMRIGKQSYTAIAIVYLNDVANPAIVKEIKERLKKVDIDMLYDSYSLEPFLEHRPYSIFKQVGYTERPDIACSRIAEGRVAIVVDGSPIVLTLPFLLIEDFHSAEDHYQKFSAATFLRFLRLFALITALILPGIYITLLQFNYNLVPLSFLMSILNATKGTPLPPLAEILLVMFLFEVLRESALRMPKIIGLAMGIVGGIVLGEAAILSGLLSPSSILVVAVSSIAMFTVPNHLGASMLLRIAFTIIGGLLGLWGMLALAVFVIHYLANFHAYEAPYLAPLAPLIQKDCKDSFIKRPVFELDTRPECVGAINKNRCETKEAKDGAS